MTGTAEHYARVSSIVAGAYGLRGEGLRTYLEDACRGDSALLAEVLGLLDHAGDEDGAAVFAEGELAIGRRALEELVDDATAPWLPERIGDYTIVRQLGRGGMGVVYEAVQESPHRRVAIKLLHPMQATPQRLRRFRHEAELLGRLQHPGIAQIFEAGTYRACVDEQPFFAMEYVDGVDIRTYCDRNGLDLAARLELLARVADAIQYAHERGVIHRDLKPDNVLVNARGQPRVLDFGVAHATVGSTLLATRLTAEGQLVGTLGYMAPELLMEMRGAVTPQVDVYALGVLGFELLTGRSPREIEDLSVPQAIALVTRSEAPLAGRFDPRLRGDVETILGKALEADRRRRYATPAAFAADLRRHLADRPIHARPPSRTYLMRKFARRHKALVGGAVATLAVAVLAVAFAIDATRRARELVRASYVSGLALAYGAFERQDYADAAGHLDALPEVHRGWEYDFLRAQLVHHVDEWELPGSAAVTAPVVDAAGGRVLAVLADGRLGAWDAESGRALSSTPLGLAWAYDGPHLKTVCLDGGRDRLAALEPERLVVLEPSTGRRVATIPTDDDPSNACFGWDGAGALLFRDAGELCLWDGVGVRRLGISPGQSRLSPAGDRVVGVGLKVGELWLADAATGERLAECWLDDAFQDLAFSPDDRYLALAGHYRNVYLLDARTLEVVDRLSGHSDSVYSVAWSADGRRLATTSADGTLRIWPMDRAGSPTVRQLGFGSLSAAAFGPHGEYVVVAGERMLRFACGDARVLRGHGSYVYRISFSPDGSRLAASVYASPRVHVWDVARAREVGLYGAPKTYAGPVGIAAPIVDFSADGRRLVVTGTQSLHWDLESGASLPVSGETDMVRRHLETLADERAVRVLSNEQALAPDGARMAVVSVMLEGGAAFGSVELYDEGFRVPSEWTSPGGFLAAVTVEPEVAPYGRLLGHVGRVLCVTFSRDGRRVVTGGDDGTVRIWDAETCEQLLVLRGHRNYVMDVQFSPDGTLLASASGDATVRLWDTLPLHERLARARD